MLVLETNNLSKKYKEHLAVNKVNMRIEKGDIYGFVGENGAGKTTVIRLLAGLASPTEGDFKLFGVSNKSPQIVKARGKLSGIVESVSLSPSLTAKNNIIFQSFLVGKKLKDEDIDNLLIKVGLDPKEIENKKVGSFSLGMRQRLGIAITLISEPEFIILDEPMNGLDPKGFVEVRDTIVELNKQGITFLISSHILSELEKVCTKIGFISHGKLIKELSIKELHQQSKPRIEVVAKQIDEVARVLKSKLSLKLVEVEGDTLSIFDEIDLNDVLKCLVKNSITVLNISKKEETIETYYMKLMGGNKNG
jgi:ABC-2 type transport system ATP-binding protein